MDKELKPCPFCGKQPILYYLLGKASIDCVNEKCKIKPSTWLHISTNKVDELVKVWNTRVEKRK